MAKILILVNPATLQILSTKDYLFSFELFSKHDVDYMPEVPPAWMALGQKSRRTEKDYVEILSNYDVVVISQHLRVCFDGWINQNLYAALLKYDGLKALFLHDEYDHTEKARQWIEEQNVRLVYTVVPEPHVSKVYAPSRFPETTFRSILTGYLPLKFSSKNQFLQMSEREKILVYRGRVSPESYGQLAKQKEDIGRYFDNYCQRNHINSDIQWEEAERVYGLDWYKLLETGVATLGTESGSNVFDEFGLIREHVSKGKALPGPDSLNFREENLGFKMNQISPRLFEAIGCGTGLVLYEGDYSGVLRADEHYLAVKSDHSNVGEVIDKLFDSAFMQNMVDRTWEHISARSELHFPYLIKLFDSDVDQRLVDKVTARKRNVIQDQPLSVGEFSDISATGIGVFSALHQDAQLYHAAAPRALKVVAIKMLASSPKSKRLVRQCLTHFRILRMHLFHWGRKAYRLLPNAFPILGRFKRWLLSLR